MGCGVSRVRPGRSVLFFFCLLAVVVCGVLFSAQQASAANLVVTSEGDDGGGGLTLRGAIGQANANSENDTITFAQDVRTVTLAQGQLNATNGQTVIDGGGVVTVTTGTQSRLFQVEGTGTKLTLRGLTLTGGNAVNEFGGALFVSIEAQAVVERSTISGNSAGFGGGGIFNGEGTLTVDSSTISDNDSEGDGGGVYNQTSPFSGSGTQPADRTTIINSTIADNIADGSGSGIFNENGFTDITYSTIANNTSTDSINGFGVTSAGGDSTGTRMGVTLVANNTASGNFADVGNADGGTEPYASLGGNVIGTLKSGTTGFTQSGDRTTTTVTQAFGTSNPTLAENDGPTRTIALQTGSVAIDRAVSGPNTDQRGATRPFDVPNVTNGSGTRDAGSFEFGANPPQTSPNYLVTRSDDRNNTCLLNDCSLREAIKAANATTVDDEIIFSNGVGVVTLGGTQLPINPTSTAGTLRIDGNTDPDVAFEVTVSANNQSRVLFVNSGANLTLTSIGITGGNAGSNSVGGGISNAGTLTVDRSSISDNSAGGDGGGIFSFGTLTVDSSTFSGNIASSRGGGIFSFTDSISGGDSPDERTTISNSTFSDNSASTSGGAIFNNNGLTRLLNTTVTNNDAPDGQGSGVVSLGNTGTRTEVYSSIIAGNQNSDVDFFTGFGTPTNTFQSDGYNIIGDGNALANFNDTGDRTNVSTADAFGTFTPTLGFNGGPTQTVELKLGSLAIDNVAASEAARQPGNDQRGVARPQNDLFDSGAYEYDGPPPNVNARPTISQIQNRTVRINSSTPQIRFTVRDTNDPASSLRVSRKSSNTNLVKPGGIKITGTGANRTVKVTPVRNRTGRAKVTLTVADPGGLKATETFSVTVRR